MWQGLVVEALYAASTKAGFVDQGDSFMMNGADDSTYYVLRMVDAALVSLPPEDQQIKRKHTHGPFSRRQARDESKDNQLGALFRSAVLLSDKASR